MNVVEEIQAISAREAASSAPYLGSRLDEAIAALLGSGIGDILETFYRQYVIRIGGQGLIQDAERLRWLKQLDIAAAPEPLALIPASGHFVLVGRHWACTDEPVVPVDDQRHVVTPDASRRFQRDMVVLADHGKFHAFAGRGLHHWFIGETSGTIVLSDWTVLRPLDPRDRADVLGAVDRQLAPAGQTRVNLHRPRSVP